MRRQLGVLGLAVLAVACVEPAEPALDGVDGIKAAGSTSSFVLKPASDAWVASVEGVGDATNLYANVDDGTAFSAADNNTTFVRALAGVEWARHSVGFSGAPAGKVTRVDVSYRAGNGGAMASTVKIYLIDDGTVVASSEERPLGSYQNFTESFAGLSVADGNKLRVRIEFHNQSGSASPRYTMLWISGTVEPVGEPARVRRSESLQMYADQIPDLATAQAFARSHDFISVNPGTQKLYPYADDMVAANPNLVLAIYTKSVHYSGPLDDVSNPNMLPEAWFAHSGTPASASNRVHPDGYASVTIMQPSSTASWTDRGGAIGPAGAVYRGWKSFQVQAVSHALATENARYGGTPFRGVWLDSAGLFSLNGQVDPSTGVKYTATTWLPLVNDAVQAVRDGLPDAIVYANGADSNPDLVDHADGLMSEGWLRAPGSSITSYPTDAAWRKDMTTAIDTQLTGAKIELLVKTWTSAASQQLEAWRRYAVASYFIADQSLALLELSVAPDQAPWTWNHGPSFNVDLGAPKDTSASVTGYRLRYLDAASPARGALYGRRFVHGVVFVNTSASGIPTTLDSDQYRRLDGTLSPKNTTIPANSGVILTLP
jgi:hypothetical protein